MNCLVTGGAGFIGSHIVDLLIDKGNDVKIIDNLSTGQKKNINTEAEFIEQDLRDYEKIHEHFKNVDCVFHVAALARILPSFEDPVKFHNVNVIGTLNCLMASVKHNVNRFIYSASSSCYGNSFSIPTDEKNKIELLNPYAVQKYEGELYCKLYSMTYKINTVILRYFNVYGPRSLNLNDKFNAYSSPVEIFLYQKHSGKKLTITWDGEQKRDYIHVYDVAKANLKAMQYQNTSYDIFNIGSGKNHTVNEIADIIGGDKTYLPKREGEARVTLANIDKARSKLKWSPTVDFHSGVKICEKLFEV